MLIRRDSLHQALSEIESGTIVGAAAVVVGRGWWDAQSMREQDAHRHRAAALGVTLSADTGLGAHCVEVRGDEERPSSSERQI